MQGIIMVIVTVTNQTWSKRFQAETAAGLLPAVFTEFGAGTVTNPLGIALTSESGDLVEGEYAWSSGELTQMGLEVTFRVTSRLLVA